MIFRLAIRGYGSGQLLFEERVVIAEEDIDTLVPDLAEKHASVLVEHERHRVEIEFLDEPDPDKRIYCFGSDPAGMKRPIGFDLRKGWN